MKTLSIALVVLMAGSAMAGSNLVYMIGNSLTDEVRYEDWVSLCRTAGVEAVFARKMIPGSPLGYHKDNPSGGFLVQPYGPPEQAFPNFSWYALTLQPFRPGEAEPALYYANLFWEHNPEAKVFVYAQWPSRNGPDWEPLFKKWCTEQYLPVMEALRATPKGSQAFMLPAGWAMYRLHKKAQLGLVPGMTNAWDLYSDGVHVNNRASYLVALSFYATIFQRNPVGLPVGRYQAIKGSDADYFEISPELAKIIQETVWEAVAGHPDSGVLSGAPPAITSPGLPEAVEREPYRYEIDASFGHPPYTFALASGSLPTGLVLTPEGAIQGTPEAQEEQAFTVKITDQAGATAQHAFRLGVGPDTAPKIATGSLPDLQQGAYLNLRLQTQGGNGSAHWSVSEGVLPPGLRLHEDGRLDGSPAGSGDYAVTLSVRDSDGANPETDRKSFSGTIASADPERVFLVRRATKAPNMEVMLDPEEGWNLVNELRQAYAGTPDNKVRFDAQWYGDSLYVLAEVEDDTVLTKDGYGIPHHKLDALVYFFDGLNNREATYNFDDRRLAYGPTQAGQDDRGWNIGPFHAATVRVENLPTGYRMKTRFQAHNIAVPNQKPGSAQFEGAGAVFGFDLVNYDLDEKDGVQTQLGWQGSVRNPDDPSGFGTLILMP